MSCRPGQGGHRVVVRKRSFLPNLGTAAAARNVLLRIIGGYLQNLYHENTCLSIVLCIAKRALHSNCRVTKTPR